ncbi:hypothetical protein [Streptomyces sp. NPDC096153]
MRRYRMFAYTLRLSRIGEPSAAPTRTLLRKVTPPGPLFEISAVPRR